MISGAITPVELFEQMVPPLDQSTLYQPTRLDKRHIPGESDWGQSCRSRHQNIPCVVSLLALRLELTLYPFQGLGKLQPRTCNVCQGNSYILCVVNENVNPSVTQ